MRSGYISSDQRITEADAPHPPLLHRQIRLFRLRLPIGKRSPGCGLGSFASATVAQDFAGNGSRLGRRADHVLRHTFTPILIQAFGGG